MNHFEQQTQTHEEVIHKLDEIMEQHYRHSDAEVNLISKKVEEFSNNIKEHHPNYKEYQLWHLLIGSTPDHERPYFDFEGEDSIEKFIESLPTLEN